MATFPTTLPKPTVDNYTLKPVDQTVRTDMEVGAARVRRRTAARNDAVSVVWLFSPEEMGEFRTWFDDGVTGINGGSSWFDIRLDTGNGSSSVVETRFKGAWEANRLGNGYWKVSAQLEVR